MMNSSFTATDNSKAEIHGNPRLTPAPKILHFHEIRRLLPYHPPWLMIDRVDDWQANEVFVARKSGIRIGSDPIVSAHFPDGPSIIPGVLLIEFVAQAGLLLQKLSNPGVAFHSVLARAKAEFMKPAHVGDILIATVSAPKEMLGRLSCRGTVHVGEVAVCRVELLGTK